MATPAVIFDLDGTLVDSEPLYYETLRQLLAEHGVPDFSWQDNERFIGIGTLETLRILRGRYGIDASAEYLLAEYNHRYLELARSRIEAYPQVRRLVEALHAAGHRLAVASGSSRAAIEAVLTGTGLRPYFPTVLSAEEAGRGKPEPDVFLEAARRLGADPADCVVVEDSPPGAEAAYRAGMRCVAIPYLPRQADDPAFATAGLLIRGGHPAVDARAVHEWIGD